MVDSPLKNLPSPLYFAIHTNGHHLRKYVVEKRLEAKYHQKLAVHFTRNASKPFKLVKRAMMMEDDSKREVKVTKKEAAKKSKRLRSTSFNMNPSPRKQSR